MMYSIWTWWYSYLKHRCTVHTALAKLCTQMQIMAFQSVFKLLSPCMFLSGIHCVYKCAYMFSRWWNNEHEQACPAYDKVSVSCSLVWESSPGLGVVLSGPISLPDTAPSPGSRHSLTFETSAVGCLISRDMPCSLPHSISIAAQTPCVGLACTDRSMMCCFSARRLMYVSRVCTWRLIFSLLRLGNQQYMMMTDKC